MSTGPPLTLAELERWQLFGATSRVVEITRDRVVVELCTCTGELVQQRESDDAELIGHLRALASGAGADGSPAG